MRLFLALALLIVGTMPAYADPISAFIVTTAFGAAFAATTAGAVVTFALTTSMAVGACGRAMRLK